MVVKTERKQPWIIQPSILPTPPRQPQRPHRPELAHELEVAFEVAEDDELLRRFWRRRSYCPHIYEPVIWYCAKQFDYRRITTRQYMADKMLIYISGRPVFLNYAKED